MLQCRKFRTKVSGHLKRVAEGSVAGESQLSHFSMSHPLHFQPLILL